MVARFCDTIFKLTRITSVGILFKTGNSFQYISGAMDERRVEIMKEILLFLTLVCRVVAAYWEALVNLIQPVRRKSVRGQNVLVTGSGHGLGRELAFRFATLGANVVLVDINQENNARVCQELASKHPDLKVVAYSVDIRDERAVERLASDALRDVGEIDVLVNNAGIVQCKPFLDLSPELIERTFQVNVLAHMWTLRHFLPAMLAKGRGHIVAISSIAGLIGGKYITDYSSSKFAVVGLMDSLEREIHDGDANPNVHLTTICPTCMSTGMFKDFTSRFSWLLPVLNAEQVADCILDAVLTNKSFAAIPTITLIFHRISYLLPAKVNLLVQDYLNYGVKPHKFQS